MHSKKILTLGYFVFCTVMVFGLVGNVKAEDKKFGEECSNFNCASGECEESNSEDEAFKGKKYCTCDDAIDCVNEFGAEPGEVWSCSDKDRFNLHFCKSNLPDKDQHAGPGARQRSSWNGVALTDDEIRKMTTKPQLKINIPGLKFTDPTAVNEADGTYLFFPLLGEYIRAVYRYGVAVAALLAVIMIIKAGFMWTASGGSSEVISKQKETIEKAVVGLIIAVSSYTILFAINPNLTDFPHLKVQYVKTEMMPDLGYLTSIEYQSITGQSFLGKPEIIQKAIQATQEAGLEDPCFMITIIGKESGGNPGAIGYDANYPRATCVWSRKKFLLGGVKSSGSTFTPPVESARDFNCARHNGYKDQNGKLVLNDERFDPNSPPDYGLGWKYSYGFGLGQVTLKDGMRCPNGERGITQYGRCFTIPELLTVDSSAFFAAHLFKSNLACAERKGYTGDAKIQAAFWAYAAGCGNVAHSNGSDISNAPGVKRAWANYQICKSGNQQFSKPETEKITLSEDENRSQQDEE